MVTPDKSPAARREATPTPSAVGSQQSLALPEPPPPAAQPAAPLRQLWLCISLPALPLEAVVDTPGPAAVFEEQQGIRKVLLATAEAEAAGVRPGLPVNAALALLPTLVLEARAPAREAEVLNELAGWCGTFTSLVHVDAPARLLLEIAGSLTLFGGLKALRQRIVGDVQRSGFYADVAIAPTPLAATWLARAGRRVCVRDARNLVGKLGPLPLDCLGWPDRDRTLLRDMGVTTVAECLRLPRQGFARRLGAVRLLELDRALGRLPDPRVAFRAAERFHAGFELAEEQSDSELILAAAEKLLEKLERFLLTRQMAVQQVEFVFFHLRETATSLCLGLAQADRSAKRWTDLLRIRFEQLKLPAPVIAVELAGGEGQALTAEAEVLPFNGRASVARRVSIDQLAERLGARVGNASVHGVMKVAEHRPDYAWCRHDIFAGVPRCASGPQYSVSLPEHRLGRQLEDRLADLQQGHNLVLQRPLWMLPEPERLRVVKGQPYYQGRLALLDGPERLETGWWDEDGIARDYFVARNPRGVRLWIYRDRRVHDEPRWFLHGMFG